MNTDTNLENKWIPTPQQIDKKRKEIPLSRTEVSKIAGFDPNRLDDILESGCDPLYSTTKELSRVVFCEEELDFPSLDGLAAVCDERPLCMKKISVDAGLHVRTFSSSVERGADAQTQTVRGVLVAIRQADPEEHKVELENRMDGISTLHNSLDNANPEDLGLSPIGERSNG